MKNKNLICPSCGQLAAQMKEASGGSYHQYDQLLQKCSVGSRTALYRLPLYAVPQLRSPLFCRSLHSGRTGLSAGGRHQKGKPGHPAVGPVWDLLFTEKILKEA